MVGFNSAHSEEKIRNPNRINTIHHTPSPPSPGHLHASCTGPHHDCLPKMSDLTGTVTRTDNGFHVESFEKIVYDFTFLDNVFTPSNPQLADLYRPWGRCLAITDVNVCALYGEAMRAYFAHHNISVQIFKTHIGEQAKTMPTMLSICHAMEEFGIIRKEPVLVVGGGLITDVAGFACATYRRTTNYVRVPTTVIGLIDASVSIKVAVNHGKNKNRLGAYHAPMHTFLDFGFLKTLPIAQIRNGFAELIKISTCADLQTFELLDKYCEPLIATGFARKTSEEITKGWSDEQWRELREAADIVNERGIHVMLRLETPNLHELDLDRVIAYGHTWSPTLELAHDPPLRHGHAISVDMAFSATLGMVVGALSEKDHERIMNLFSRAGLAIDDELLTEEMLQKGTEAIMKTRDGKLRAAVPSPRLGSCRFLNDEVSGEVMGKVLKVHKEFVRKMAREGRGVDAFVPRSEMGGMLEEMKGEGMKGMVGFAGEVNGDGVGKKSVGGTAAGELMGEFEEKVRSFLAGSVGLGGANGNGKANGGRNLDVLN